MKKLIGWPVTWALFGAGHVLSFIGPLYPLCSWFMLASSDVQDWAGLKSPWG